MQLITAKTISTPLFEIFHFFLLHIETYKSIILDRSVMTAVRRMIMKVLYYYSLAHSPYRYMGYFFTLLTSIFRIAYLATEKRYQIWHKYNASN